jgi:hypothetical protein
MRDKLKRLHAKNFFKQWAPTDFNAGNGFSQEEFFTAVPSGTRCVLESFSINSVYSGSSISNSSGINNNRDSTISFRTGSSTGPLILEVKPQFSSYGIVLFGKNVQSPLFDIPCGGTLFADGLFVGLTARTSTSSGPSEPNADYGFNVNIFYSGGS